MLMNINTLHCCVTCYEIHNFRTVYHYYSQRVQRMSQHNSKDRYYADLPLVIIPVVSGRSPIYR